MKKSVKQTFEIFNPFGADLKTNGGVYMIRNKTNSYVYVGSTHCFWDRLECHKRRAIQEYQTAPLYQAIREYGIENFVFEIIAVENDTEKRISRETGFIRSAANIYPIYNVVMQAYMPRKMTPELHMKLSNSHRRENERVYNSFTKRFEERKNA